MRAPSAGGGNHGHLLFARTPRSARVVLAVAVAALALDARAQTDGLSPPGTGTSPPKVEPATPLLRALNETLARREASGRPVPSSVEYTYEVSGGAAAPEAGLLAVEPATQPVTVTARAVLRFDTPEQAGYVGQWPPLQIRSPFPANPEIVVPEGDYTERYRQYVEQRAPGAWELVPFGREPRTYSLTETITIDAAAGSPVEAALQALGGPSAPEGAVADVLMGFGYIGPNISYVIEDDLGVDIPVIGWIEVYYFKAGLEFGWALGLRLPAEVGLTGPVSIASVSSGRFFADLSPRDWSAGRYEYYGVAGESGNEFVLRENFYFGLTARVLGIDLCPGCAITSDVNASSSFPTPFGAGSYFPIDPVKVPAYTRDFEVVTFSIGFRLQPHLGSTRITANAGVSGGSATGGGTVTFSGPDVAVGVGVDACLKPGASRSAALRLDDFRYWFDQFQLELQVYGEIDPFDPPDWLPQIPSWEVWYPVATIDLSRLSSGAFLGKHVECNAAFACAPKGPSNAVQVSSYVTDGQAPTTTLAIAGTSGNEGWYVSDVALTLTASDNPPGCGIGVAAIQYAVGGAWTPYARPLLISTDGVAPFSWQSWDHDLNTDTHGPVLLKVDRTPPAISATLSPPPNVNGWNAGDVFVQFEALDLVSGLATPSRWSQRLSAEGAGQVVSGSATDVAGNSASTAATVYIDRTAPTISGAAKPPPNAHGWNRGDVTVTFIAADPLSGVEEVSPPRTFTAEGVIPGVTGTATDRAGNEASATVGPIRIDRTPPTIVGEAPEPNAYGWYAGDVMVVFGASDALSGIASFTQSQFVTTEGAGQSATGTALDRAGNLATATVSGINVDKTPPALLVLSPLPVAYTNTASFDVLWEASDPFSGVLAQYAELDGIPVLNLQPVDLMLLAPGTHVLHVSALDRADHLAEAVVPFEVTVDVDGLWAATERVCELGWIDKYGICVSLWAKLDAARASLGRGDLLSAQGQLEAFLHELAAQWYKAVNPAAHEILTVDALYLLQHLG